MHEIDCYIGGGGGSLSCSSRKSADIIIAAVKLYIIDLHHETCQENFQMALTEVKAFQT